MRKKTGILSIGRNGSAQEKRGSRPLSRRWRSCHSRLQDNVVQIEANVRRTTCDSDPQPVYRESASRKRADRNRNLLVAAGIGTVETKGARLKNNSHSDDSCSIEPGNA
jgi:hypothetical protein